LSRFFNRPVDCSTSSLLDGVADGVLRLRLPVPFGRLGDVNAYLLEDAAGWTVVDTGLNTPGARKTWVTGLAHTGIAFEAIQRIVLTHSHPDHIGLAGWLQRRVARAGGAAPVYLTHRERELARYWSAAEASNEPLVQLFRRCGVPEAMLGSVASDMAQLRQATQPHPTNVCTLSIDEPLRIGARRFDVLHTPGHSDGHAALYDADARLLLAGDHVLPHITPTISRWPSTAPNPLGRYLRSLREVEPLAVRCALPGHGAVINDWPGRVRAIRAHHAERLAVMQRAVGTGATVFNVAQQAFVFDALDAGEARFAIAETLAHLDYLVEENRLHRHDEATAWRFAPATSARASAA
jgi:glyoxylase-like metal-dependent hydrolase (beta-lactamase superfamily II)